MEFDFLGSSFHLHIHRSIFSFIHLQKVMQQTELSLHIQSTFGCSNDEVAAIGQFFKPQLYKRGEYFLKGGRQCRQLGFVQSGIMREFVFVNHKEVTKWIATPGYFVVDITSFTFQTPARWNIQAVTDCQVYVVNKEDYQKITALVPKWPELEKLFITKCFGVMEERILQLLSLSAEERYHSISAINPDLIKEVPQQYIASMLGMTPETFSRIRKKQAL
jgi:CRP-like cAMP-binding protein